MSNYYHWLLVSWWCICRRMCQMQSSFVGLSVVLRGCADGACRVGLHSDLMWWAAWLFLPPSAVLGSLLSFLSSLLFSGSPIFLCTFTIWVSLELACNWICSQLDNFVFKISGLNQFSIFLVSEAFGLEFTMSLCIFSLPTFAVILFSSFFSC